MELLLILTYNAICTVIFKVFRIPINKWSVPTAVLGGVLIIGALVLAMNYNHPYSESTRWYFQSIPMVPQVRGRVVEVPVQANVPIKQGDVLFRMEDTPYREQVESLQARLDKANDDSDHMKLELDRAESMEKQGAASNRETERWRAQYEASIANIDDIQSQLDSAKFDLDSTVVRAPSDGMVTQLVLQPGMMVARAPLQPVLVFLPDVGGALVGWYRQNSLLRLKPGTDAEVTFDALPGQVFSAKVRRVLPAIAEGQVVPSSDLVEYDPKVPPGRIPVILDIDDPDFEQYQLPHGMFGQSAIYTEHAHHVAIMRKLLLRMASWMDYLFPFH
jgi:RND family efflux transporter MFP subunit